MNGTKLVDEYVGWLREQTKIEIVGDWTAIMTPFLDRHNDFLQIYVKQNGDEYLLTDDGYILQDLAASGCTLDTPKRKSLLKVALNGYGVRCKDGELVATATRSSFPAKKHGLIQAMLAVDDLYYLAQPHVASLLWDDVREWFAQKGISHIAGIKLGGISGYDHKFDFAIPETRERPERLLRTINTPQRNSVLTFVTAWQDVRELRPAGTRAIAVLNDIGQTVRQREVDALAEYDIGSVLWSQREQHVEEFAA